MVWLEKRPRKRSECLRGRRPCPWVTCRYHLLDACMQGTGRKTSVELWGTFLRMKCTCTLDVADRLGLYNDDVMDDGTMRLDTIADILNCTKQNVNQIAKRAYRKIRDRIELTREDMELRDYAMIDAIPSIRYRAPKAFKHSEEETAPHL